jgi:hypothetical protein
VSVEITGRVTVVKYVRGIGIPTRVAMNARDHGPAPTARHARVLETDANVPIILMLRSLVPTTVGLANYMKVCLSLRRLTVFVDLGMGRMENVSVGLKQTPNVKLLVFDYRLQMRRWGFWIIAA